MIYKNTAKHLHPFVELEVMCNSSSPMRGRELPVQVQVESHHTSHSVWICNQFSFSITFKQSSVFEEWSET